jgi:UDP-N-acetylmuramoylalanine--D-glutamate ligase
MKEAVAVGFTVTPQGGILLLSPGCASFDMFVDYLDRAQQFRNNCLRYDV